MEGHVEVDRLRAAWLGVGVAAEPLLPILVVLLRRLCIGHTWKCGYLLYGTLALARPASWPRSPISSTSTFITSSSPPSPATSSSANSSSPPLASLSSSLRTSTARSTFPIGSRGSSKRRNLAATMPPVKGRMPRRGRKEAVGREISKGHRSASSEDKVWDPRRWPTGSVWQRGHRRGGRRRKRRGGKISSFCKRRVWLQLRNSSLFQEEIAKTCRSRSRRRRSNLFGGLMAGTRKRSRRAEWRSGAGTRVRKRKMGQQAFPQTNK